MTLLPNVDLGSIKNALNESYADQIKQDNTINVTNILGQIYKIEHNQSQ